MKQRIDVGQKFVSPREREHGGRWLNRPTAAAAAAATTTTAAAAATVANGLVGPRCDACASDAFLLNLNDTQCFDLAEQVGALEAASCRASCCADRACSVWQFCPGDDPAATCNGPPC